MSGQATYFWYFLQNIYNLSFDLINPINTNDFAQLKMRFRSNLRRNCSCLLVGINNSKIN